MAYPDSKYILLPPIQTTYWSKLGGAAFGSEGSDAALSNGTITFYRDSSRSELKSVYQISESPSPDYLFVELPNPLTLSATGAVVNPETGVEIALYGWPYQGLPEDNSNVVDLYYVVLRDSSGLLQATQAAWPSGVAIPASDATVTGAQNLLTNPQFAEILFTVDPTSATKVYSVSGTSTETPIAPGWSLITTGTGTVTVFQKSVTNTTATTNPPYALDIQGAGSLSVLQVRQRLSNSPRLVANGFVSASFVVNSQDSSAHDLTLTYTPSSGTAHTLISFTTTGSLSFESASGAAQINGTINTAGATGYVDVILTMPVLAHLQISSFQMVQTSNVSTFPPFYQQSTDEQKKDLYWYWDPLLKFKPIQSMLVGWDFAVNPRQFFVSPGAVGTSASYIWDQTIMGRVTGTATVTLDADTNGMKVTTGVANTAFYCLQYLTGTEAKELLGTSLSINCVAYTTTAVASPPTARFYIYRAGPATAVPTLPTTVGTIGTDGVFTITAGGWAEFPRSSQGEAIGTVAAAADYSALNTNADLGFSGWQVTSGAVIADTDKVAIVAAFLCPTAATALVIRSISLVPGNIPTRPAPKTFQETLYQCRRSYEQSFPNGLPATATNVGSELRMAFCNPLTTDTTNSVKAAFAQEFEITFQAPKRNASYTFTIYDLAATSGNVAATIINAGASAATANVALATFWTLFAASDQRRVYNATSVTQLLQTAGAVVGSIPHAYIQFHWIADNRLGI